jgi:hypothetical protein
MGTAQVVFEEVERGGATGSHVTGSDVSHVTGSGPDQNRKFHGSDRVCMGKQFPRFFFLL